MCIKPCIKLLYVFYSSNIKKYIYISIYFVYICNNYISLIKYNNFFLIVSHLITLIVYCSLNIFFVFLSLILNVIFYHTLVYSYIFVYCIFDKLLLLFCKLMIYFVLLNIELNVYLKYCE